MSDVSNIPTISEYEVIVGDDGKSATVKVKPIESIDYDNGLVALLESFDPPPLSQNDMDVLQSLIE